MPDNSADPLRVSVSIQSRASAMGFDWPDAGGVLDKIEEETGEIREALCAGDAAHARHELGDLLLACVNLSRFLDVDPAQALHDANEKFSRRFAAVENKVRQTGRSMQSYSLGELDAIWNEVKSSADKGLEQGG